MLRAVGLPSRGIRRSLSLAVNPSCLFPRAPLALRKRAEKNPLRMSNALVVCEVDESLKAKLKKFRFRKETTNAAIIMKIDMEKQLVIVDEEYEDISMDDLREELPERQPSPMGCKPEQQMMYAGSKTGLVHAADLTKVFETRNTDDLTEEWLRNQLGFFG